MAATQSTLESNWYRHIVHVTLPADADSIDINISGANFITLDSLNSLTADTVHVYMASSNAPVTAEWSTYVLPTGDEPFTATNNYLGTPPLDVRGVTWLRLTRSGAADGTAPKFNIVLSK